MSLKIKNIQREVTAAEKAKYVPKPFRLSLWDNICIEASTIGYLLGFNRNQKEADSLPMWYSSEEGKAARHAQTNKGA